MKKIIIISSYATTPEKEKTLNDCIDKVSHKGYDVYILFISNFSGCNLIYEINSISKEFFPGMWHFKDGEILDRKSFIVSEFDRNKISEKGRINFK